jgi:hypothetical protein
MPLLTVESLKQNYLSVLSSLFKNPNITSDQKTDSGVTRFKIMEVSQLCLAMYSSLKSLNDSAKAVDVKVLGGGGAPGGVWSGGTGTGGKFTYVYSLDLSPAFDFSSHTLWTQKVKQRLTEAVKSYVNSFVWTSLQFAEGTSTHTVSTQGNLVTAKNVKTNLSSVGTVSPGSPYTNFSDLLKEDMKSVNFVLTKWLEEDIRVLNDWLQKSLTDWYNNTSVENVIASGGFTAISTGTLIVAAYANGGKFS